MDKRVANEILNKLDNIAGAIEKMSSEGKISPRISSDLTHQIDAFSDKFEIATFGKDNLRARSARVLQKDKDEPYMDTFDKPFGVHQKDTDEPYMDTYDIDQSANVTDRDEYAVRDTSPLSDGTKRQPSWARGPAGKSTRQGSSKPKTWAP